MALLHRLPINVDTAPVDIDATIATARIHRLSAYDAAYLALSERSGLPLATLDNALAGAAADAGVLLVVPR
jgi:predicted nucleic acid-binding protein